MKYQPPKYLPQELCMKISEYIDYSEQLSDYITESDDTTHTTHRMHSPYELMYYTKDVRNSSLIHTFPEPLKDSQGLPISVNINMMPFILGDNNTIPENLKRYIPLIDVCAFNCNKSEHLKVCYLTIDESFVKKGSSHRRHGLHTETIGIDTKSGYGTYYHNPPWWGGAHGGIFMGSNMDNSTAIYDYYVKDINAIGTMGCLEHMRNTLNKNKKRILKKGEIAWITDRTPHESLKIEQDGFRQFFRIVTSNVSLWYSKHSTPNPLGILPPETTKIIDIDKFEFCRNL